MTRVSSDEAAKKVCAALTKAGIPCEALAVPVIEALDGVELAEDHEPAPLRTPPPPPPRAQAAPAPRQTESAIRPAKSSMPSHTTMKTSIPWDKVGSYVQGNLVSGERVLYVGKLSLWPYWLLILIAMVMVLGAFSGGKNAALNLVIGIGCLLPVVIAYYTTELAVTNKRVIAKFGFISRKTVELKMKKIESIQVNQGILGRICNYGTIIVAGTGMAHAPIPNISNPLRFRDECNAAQEAAEEAA
ncbi:MAG: PH domain-containing protein [Stagnimonas sp.]|nr:PH domain-containing protein [Stagnimonas sp.]